MTSIPGGSPDARHCRLVAEPHHLDDLCRAAVGLPTWTPLVVFLAAFTVIWAPLSFRRRRATHAALGATSWSCAARAPCCASCPSGSSPTPSGRTTPRRRPSPPSRAVPGGPLARLHADRSSYGTDRWPTGRTRWSRGPHAPLPPRAVPFLA
ncbi:hypothetical protein [Nocardioides taihuensis]|uniref:Uncharacterized protein n=1 Tax=Nocardioides taihuensis TaxID=1835606 RepID=A0ABW0BH41_9ACTN